jgi:lipid-A-disaccharide synthase
VKSGTSTLEAAVADAPQVVVYDGPKVMRLQAHIMGVRKRVPFVAMPNILLQRRIVPELLGEDCTPQNIAREVSSLLGAGNVSTRMRADYALVRQAWEKTCRLVLRNALPKSWMRCCTMGSAQPR